MAGFLGGGPDPPSTPAKPGESDSLCSQSPTSASSNAAVTPARKLNVLAFLLDTPGGPATPAQKQSQLAFPVTPRSSPGRTPKNPLDC